MDLTSIIAFSLKQHASDIHLSSGHCLRLRINGRIQAFPNIKLNPVRLQEQLLTMLDNAQRKQLQQQQLDYAFDCLNVRFRGHLFYQRQGISAVFRIIQGAIPSLAELGIPPILTHLITKRNGLILITGATGSGKSTTLSALIQWINHSLSQHIITLEDPIEFIHQSQRSLIQQREVGRHTATFHTGLQSILRQDPDIILLGEIRDHDTIKLALTAAETGHLVFATLHTHSATQSIERLIDVFSADDKAFVRLQLAQNLLAVLSQRLIFDNTLKKRIADFEVLINTPAVSHLIRESKIHQIISVMQTSTEQGMQLFQHPYTP